MSEIYTCSICGELCAEDDSTIFDGETFCPECLARETAICSYCGRRIWQEDDAGDEDGWLCQDCYHDRQSENAVINDYNYRPYPIFFGEGPKFFGVELEIDRGGEIPKHAEQIMNMANTGGKEHLYCKHDGSLADGIELVTHPMSLNYHRESMPWAEILEEAKRLGYRSHQAKTCGLHVHVSREAFGEDVVDQDAAIARVLYFVERHWEELLKFSRRTPRQMEEWADRYGYKDRPQDILDHVKKNCRSTRYTCVNLLNEETVEFRMFRGTLKLNTLIATLQLVDRLCDVAINLSDKEVKAMSWTTFAAGCEEPELVQYLKERRLYVNDPVEAEEEV